MKAPLEWIKDFTEIDVEVKELAEKMTLTGSKVEEVIISGEDIQNVYTGKILSVVPHQDSDHLVICQLEMNLPEIKEPVQIVTGAPNAEAGMICPVALSGATLPGGSKIKAGKLRGVESNGMCCSIQELGYSTADFSGGCEDGLWKMPADTPLGMDIKEYLGLGSVTIDFEITSNRPDCFSVEGLGREAAITLEKPFRPIVPDVKAENPENASGMAKVEILEPEKCFRYCSRIITDVVIKSSPEWMQKRLRDAGMRPINNIVDITNYVCLELGQPMHAFDLSYLSGHHIIVRNARQGETVITLDNIERVLDSSMLVIADEEKACAIAGVMGCENSEVAENTKTILFESATFDAITTRQTAVKCGLRTEASLRYEKGLDAENAYRALQRACELVELLDCGKVCQGTIDEYPTKKDRKKIDFSASRVNQFLGTEIDSGLMLDILTKLGCVFESETICIAPTYRPDLESEADLSEEIARFYGYNKIIPTLLTGKETTLGGRTRAQKTVEKIKDVFVAQGFFEAITYSFESPKEMDKLLVSNEDVLRKQVIIQNPLGDDFSVMRSSMVPSLLRVAATNANRSVKTASVFESAYVYLPSDDKNLLPEERATLCAFSYQTEIPDDGNEFFRMKGVLEEMSANLGLRSLMFEPVSDFPFLHPTRSASIIIRGKRCGFIGYVHPDAADAFHAPKQTVLLNFEIDAVVQEATDKRSYKPLPKYPGIMRDLAVVLDSTVPVGEIEKIIRKRGGKFLESFQLFDIYEGEQVGSGKKSVAYNLFFRSDKQTLTDEDIQQGYEDIRKTLEEKLQAFRR